MTGIMDVGGGLRAVYSAGIYDRLLDEGIKLKYCIGVSAGSANLITYVAGQRGRNVRFYTEYAFRSEYMSVSNLLRKKSYIDLDYVYSTLCNSDGEDPLDYASFRDSKVQYLAVATAASDGSARYFGKDSIAENNYAILKASCAIPAVCRPYCVGGEYYFDGGVSDPFPFKRAFADGCDRLIAVLSRPLDYVMHPQRLQGVMRLLLHGYPHIAAEVMRRHEVCNQAMSSLKELEREGRVLLVAPRECFGVNTLTRNRSAFESLYSEGCKDAEKIKRFITTG